jgi:hypothetical protein
MACPSERLQELDEVLLLRRVQTQTEVPQGHSTRTPLPLQVVESGSACVAGPRFAEPGRAARAWPRWPPAPPCGSASEPRGRPRRLGWPSRSRRRTERVPRTPRRGAARRRAERRSSSHRGGHRRGAKHAPAPKPGAGRPAEPRRARRGRPGCSGSPSSRTRVLPPPRIRRGPPRRAQRDAGAMSTRVRNHSSRRALCPQRHRVPVSQGGESGKSRRTRPG